MSSYDESIARSERNTFKPASADSPPDVRSAVALEFIARMMGDIASSLDHLSNDQMNSLVDNLPSS